MEVDINPNSLPIEFIEKIPLVQDLMDDASRFKDLMKEVKVPYIISDKVLLSEGIWNDNFYSEEEIKKAVAKTDWTKKENRSIFLDHKDGETTEWVGEVQNVRYEPGVGAIGDLVIVDFNTALKLYFGAKFGVSAKVEGDVENKNIKDFLFLNNSIVINPACKTAWINNAEVSKVESKPEEKKLELADLVTKIEELAKNINDNNSKFEERLTSIEKKLAETPKPVPVETPPAAPAAPEPEVKFNEELKAKEAEISELNKKIVELNEKLNEPAKVTQKSEVDVKTETLDEKIGKMNDEELNENFAKHIMLKSQGKMNLKK